MESSDKKQEESFLKEKFLYFITLEDDDYEDDEDEELEKEENEKKNKKTQRWFLNKKQFRNRNIAI